MSAHHRRVADLPAGPTSRQSGGGDGGIGLTLARMPLQPADLYPPFALSITAGPLQLRAPTDADVLRLCEVAQSGIHSPDWTPFSSPWTDVPAEELAANTARYFWHKRAAFSAEAMDLLFGVWWEGTLVGVQGLSTADFAVTRTGETGSWLGRAYQGKGIGTRMRQAVCAFAFDELGAAEVTSGAFLDNPASLAVSRKVGYRPDGVRRLRRRDQMVLNQRLVLTPATFVRGPGITTEGADLFRTAVGLDRDTEANHD